MPDRNTSEEITKTGNGALGNVNVAAAQTSPLGTTVHQLPRDLTAEDIEQLRDKFRADSEFRPTWENRRKVIFGTLYLCGGLIALIVLVPLLASFLPGYDLKEPVADILTAALYILAFTAVAVIGSYVFGAAFESRGYRASLNELAKTMRGR